MFRVTQIVGNTSIRIGSFLSILFGNIISLLRQFLDVSGKFLGFAKSEEFFLDFNDAQSIKRNSTEELVKVEPTTKPESPVQNRRRSYADMDYYMSMAQQVKKK